MTTVRPDTADLSKAKLWALYRRLEDLTYDVDYDTLTNPQRVDLAEIVVGLTEIAISPWVAPQPPFGC